MACTEDKVLNITMRSMECQKLSSQIFGRHNLGSESTDDDDDLSDQLRDGDEGIESSEEEEGGAAAAMTGDTLEPEPSKSKQESQSRSPSSSPDSFEQVEPDKSPTRESSPSSPDGEVESDPKSPSSLLGTDDSSSSPCPTLDLHETALTGDTLEPEPSKSKLESDSRSPSSSSDSFERVEPAQSVTRESSPSSPGSKEELNPKSPSSPSSGTDDSLHCHTPDSYEKVVELGGARLI